MQRACMCMHLCTDSFLARVHALVSSARRQREATLTQLHEIHEQLENDIEQAREGNTRIGELMQEMIQVCGHVHA